MAEDEIDFEGEGLLEGLRGKARKARLELLGELSADGVTIEELREAVEEGRLALLPVERAITGADRTYTAAEVAEAAGVDEEVLLRQRQALGLPIPDPAEETFTDEDIEAAKGTRLAIEAGLPAEGMVDVARVIGMSMAQLAEANRALIVGTFVEEGASELEVAHRLADAAEQLMPTVAPALAHAYGLHLREAIRQGVIGAAGLDGANPAGSQEIAVSFADLVGFTRLGERLEVSEIGELSGRLGEIATAAAKPPVRLVKLIGDAAMLVSTATEPLMEATLELVEAAERADDIPPLKAGVARGHAIGRGGDWYGRPVNLAARITNAARPDSVLVAGEVRDALKEEGDAGFRFSFAGQRRLKGIRDEVKLFRVRRDDDPDGAANRKSS